MTNQNQIVNRLQQRERQINGMLTPGLDANRSDQAGGSMSSIFTRFGGGKFKLAAKKMQFLDTNKLGRQHPETIERFSKDIPERFKGVNKLLHFSPSEEKDSGLWTKIERPLPNQGMAQFDAPAQPGELRRGSVIQSLPMFPKPGQSIESFKEQARSLPKIPTKTIPRKPSLDPTSRLYSRVQEIPQKEEKIETTPVESPSIEPKSTSTDSQKTGGDTVHRQEDRPDEQDFKPIESTETILPPKPIAEIIPEQIETKSPHPGEIRADLTRVETPRSPEQPDPEIKTDVLPKPAIKAAEPPKREQKQPGDGELLKAKRPAKGKTSRFQLPKAKPSQVQHPKSRPSQTQLQKTSPSQTQLPQVQRKPDAPAVSKARPASDVGTPDQVQEPSPDQKIETSKPRQAQPAVKDAEPRPVPHLPQPEHLPGITSEISRKLPLPTPESRGRKTAARDKTKPGPPTSPDQETVQRPVRPLDLPEGPLDAALAEIKAETTPTPMPEEPGETIPEPFERVRGKVEGTQPAAAKSPAPDMTLRKKIESRRQVAKTIKSLEPQDFKPTLAAPFIIQRATPLVHPQKYHRETQGMGRSKGTSGVPFTSHSPAPQSSRASTPTPLTPEGQAVFQRDRTPFPMGDEGKQQQTDPLSLSLAYPPAPGIMQTMPKGQQPARQTFPALEAPLALLPPGNPEELSTQLQPEFEQSGPGMISSSEDKPTGTRKVETVRRVDEPSDDEDETPEIDLDQIAEKVLPKVKRILEIESERLSRYRR